MTEKEYNTKQRENKVLNKQKNIDKKEISSKKKPVEETKKEEVKKEEKIEEKVEETKNEVAKKESKEKQKKEIPKKDEAIINGKSLPLSTKDCVAVCKFIKFKTIDKAIEDLEEVSKFKKAIPMKKGFPHRKGKGMMAGRYHTKTVKYFIKLLKELKANSNVNGLENPIVQEAIANRASMPYGRFGRTRKKRTHITIKAKDKEKLEKK